MSLEFKKQSFSFVLHVLTPKTFMEHIRCVWGVCGWGVSVCAFMCVCTCVFALGLGQVYYEIIL